MRTYFNGIFFSWTYKFLFQSNKDLFLTRSIQRLLIKSRGIIQIHKIHLQSITDEKYLLLYSIHFLLYSIRKILFTIFYDTNREITYLLFVCFPSLRHHLISPDLENMRFDPRGIFLSPQSFKLFNITKTVKYLISSTL